MQAIGISNGNLAQREASSQAEMPIDGLQPLLCSELQEVVTAMELLIKLKEEGNK